MAIVANCVDCAFNFNRVQAAFIFTAGQCVVINYGTLDSIQSEPMSITEYFPCLSNTLFATRIDAAFTSSVENEVYIFKSNMFVYLNFSTRDIIGVPNEIAIGFPFLNNTIFKDGIDAAFASSQNNEAYIFKGDQYALISFAPGRRNNQRVITRNITDGFPSLRDTVFRNGLDAAFSSTEANKAYIFKGNNYAIIDYAPGRHRIIEMMTPITRGFKSLEGIISSNT